MASIKSNNAFTQMLAWEIKYEFIDVNLTIFFYKMFYK